MKKLLFLLLLAVGTLTARAGTYAYLTFVTTDGAKVSVPVESLSLTVSGSTLTTGKQSFTLTNLAKMYFTVADESNTTGIGKLADATNRDVQTATEVYDLGGHRVAKRQMKRGAYIVKTKQGNYKLVVR